MDKKGITFFEFIIIILVFLIVASVAIFTVKSILDRTDDALVKSQAKTVELAVELCLAKNDGDIFKVEDVINDADLGIGSGSFSYYLNDSTVKSGRDANADIVISFQNGFAYVIN